MSNGKSNAYFFDKQLCTLVAVQLTALAMHRTAESFESEKSDIELYGEIHLGPALMVVLNSMVEHSNLDSVDIGEELVLLLKNWLYENPKAREKIMDGFR